MGLKKLSVLGLLVLWMLAACNPVFPRQSVKNLPVTGKETPAPAYYTPTFINPFGSVTPTLAITDIVVGTPAPQVGLQAQSTGDQDVLPLTTGTPVEVDHQGRPSLLSSVMDYEVRNLNGVTVGDVNALVLAFNTPASTGPTVAPPTGAPFVQYVLFQPNPKQGWGDRLLFLPWEIFDPLNAGMPAKARALFLKVDQKIVLSAPGFAAGATPDVNLVGWDQETASYWKAEGINVEGAGAAPDSLQRVLIERGFGGLPAVGLQGEDLGVVQDFIVYPRTGQFRYALLAPSGGLTLMDRLIPLPMSLVVWQLGDLLPAPGSLLVKVQMALLQDAPFFGSIDEIDPTQVGWDRAVESYWAGR